MNDLTLDYGERGRQGLERLMADAFQQRPDPADACRSSSRNTDSPIS